MGSDRFEVNISEQAVDALTRIEDIETWVVNHTMTRGNNINKKQADNLPPVKQKQRRRQGTKRASQSFQEETDRCSGRDRESHGRSRTWARSQTSSHRDCR